MIACEGFMKDIENIYDQIQELLGVEENNINILEEQIDSDTQFEYFEHSKNHRNERTEAEVIEMKDLIFDPSTSVDTKKSLLVQLASLNNVDAFRTIEKYLTKPNIKLYDWACMALQESKLLIESKLLEENRILITTGLGGKGLKLRYFIVFFTKTGNDITYFQQNILRKEIAFTLSKVHAEIEEISFSNHLAMLLTIIPIKVNIQNLFHLTIKECNQFGSFLFEDYIVTNMKILEKDEIEELLAINNVY